jgi:hypothetical protein
MPLIKSEPSIWFSDVIFWPFFTRGLFTQNGPLTKWPSVACPSWQRPTVERDSETNGPGVIELRSPNRSQYYKYYYFLLPSTTYIHTWISIQYYTQSNMKRSDVADCRELHPGTYMNLGGLHCNPLQLGPILCFLSVCIPAQNGDFDSKLNCKVRNAIFVGKFACQKMFSRKQKQTYVHFIKCKQMSSACRHEGSSYPASRKLASSKPSWVVP